MSEDHEENLDDTFQEPRKKFWQVNNYKLMIKIKT